MEEEGRMMDGQTDGWMGGTDGRPCSPCKDKAIAKALGGPLHSVQGGEGHPSSIGKCGGVDGTALVGPGALGHLLQNLLGIKCIGGQDSVHCVVLHIFLQMKHTNSDACESPAGLL